MGPATNSALPLEATPYLSFFVSFKYHQLQYPFDEVPHRLQNVVSLTEWLLLWYQLDTISRRSRLLGALSDWGIPCVWAGYLGLLFWWHLWLDHNSLTLLLYWSSLMVMLDGSSAAKAALKKSELQQLRVICRSVEERLFRRHGWAVECTYEPVLCCCIYKTMVYFIPVVDRNNARSALLESGTGSEHVGDVGEYNSLDRDDLLAYNGYLRILLFKDGGYQWNPMAISYLESFKTLPANLMPRDEQCWAQFWSKMLEQSRMHLTMYHAFSVFNWSMYPCLVILACLVESGVWSYNSVHIAFWFIVGTLLAAPILGNIIAHDTRTLLRDYMPELARQGLFVEFRITEGFYLCLFPIKVTNEIAHTLPSAGNVNTVPSAPWPRNGAVGPAPAPPSTDTQQRKGLLNRLNPFRFIARRR
jgi:hypothetical protein